MELKYSLHVIALLLNCRLLCTAAPVSDTTVGPGKVLYLPAKVWKVPDNNDYTDNNSEFSNVRKVESADIALFWPKEYGDDPRSNTTGPRFVPDEAIQELERFYICYRDTLKFVTRGSSLTDKYKMATFIFYTTTDGTAYGGGIDKRIGALWTPASRIARAPYGALAHELGHSFQYMVHADGAWGFTTSPAGSKGQPIFEMTSQYMLFQIYPYWMTFEHYHLVSFLHQTHLAFLHEQNQYHSPYVLEYWSGKHGRDFVGKLWRSAKEGEDPVMTYKRLNSLTQTRFNDELFDAYRRFITWDMPRIEEVARPYANLHISTFNEAGGGWYKIAESNCPQNYGYNGIKLKVPEAGTQVKLEFRGMAGAPGYRAIHTDKAGWRYGFLAVKADGSRIYGKMYADNTGKARFTVPEGTRYLWLVVSGAPTAHWIHLSDGDSTNDEQWPYRIRLTGTALDDADIK